MLNCKKIGHYLISIIGLFLYCTHITEAEVKSVSACHGTTSTTCHYITLECDPESRIRILSMKYGVKTNDCNNNERRSRCLDPDKNGCCVFSTDDCMEYYSDLHAYNLHRDCSGKQSCGPLPVPNSNLNSCDGRISTYVLVTYECQPEHNDVKFCRVDNYNNVNGTQLSVVFNNAEDKFTSPANCSCFISSDGNINIDYVDVRMITTHTSTQGSDCSSAVLTTVPHDNIDTQCDSSVNEHNNFIYSELSQTDKKFIEVKLLNLYLNGNNDAPQFIWLNINAEDQNDVNVQCFKHEHQTTPLPPTTGTNQPSNTTKSQNSDTEDEGSNTGVIVAGILVPIILLAVIGAIVILLVRRRRGYLCKRKQKHATPNKYTENAEIENSVENSEYAEIGFVPDIPDTGLTYPVNETKNKRTVQELNGHTYQNVGNKDNDEGKRSKTSKGKLGTLKSHADRLISFFRNQTENDFPQVKKRDRENSYDHLRPVSANSTVEVTPPNEKSLHMYSHTTDDSVKRQIAMNQDKNKDVKKTKASPKIDKPSVAPTEEINAFHVGDSYIEFQFGAVDESHPDLVKSPKEINENTRPAPPSRPPPSPKSTPKQHRPVLNVQNDTRSKSPNFLSPQHTSPIDSLNYDYAAGAQVKPRSVSPHGSDVSDTSSVHSYKILEKQDLYDYAEVSDGEVEDNTGAYTSGSIYEDVDKNPRSVSVRKHKSATEIPLDTNGYLEPVTSRTRAISSPASNSEPEENKSVASLLKTELKEKTQQKKQTKSPKSKPDKNSDSVGAGKQKGSDDSDTVKSDNVDTKDYQKIDEVKGVLKMAKIFENKDSDSDSSRQSSPRNIQITIGNNQKLKKTSSDA